MKKCYLTLLLAGGLTGVLFSQTSENTYIAGNQVIKIQPNTLFYTGSDMVLTAQADQPSVLMNEGKIKINGDFVSANSSDGGSFLNVWNAEDNYGQVIINENSTSSGRMAMQKPSINPGTFTWGQFAIPYQFGSAEEAFETLFTGVQYQTNNPGGASNRYYHSIMTWDNMTRPEYDHIPPGTSIKPTDYVILNLTNHTELIDQMAGIRQAYGGTPANGTHSVSYNSGMYRDVSVPWSTWMTQRNWYNEAYSTYIEEHIRQSNSTHYGRYYFQFGNPYTSNIDLSYIGLSEIDGDSNPSYVQGLMGVVKIMGTGWNAVSGIENPLAIRAIWNGSEWGGDPDALLIRPFEGFYIGLKSEVETTRGVRSFVFNDGLKTFSMTPAEAENVLGDFGDVTTTRHFVDTNFQGNTTEDRLITNQFITVSPNVDRKAFYQLKLTLYTEDDINTGNSVFVIVDSKSQTGIAQPLESDYTDFTSGFFLSQENADGSEVSISNRVMQINAVNPRYVAKPIPLFLKKSANDMNGYFLKADLFYQNIFSKLKQEDINFIDGNSFFFYDKAMDVLLPITTDFSYYIERSDEPQSNRYVIYWNGGPETGVDRMSVEETLASTTQVYKDGDVHKIRFDKSWSTADVTVYDLAGRVILERNGVPTQTDYVLELPKTMVYVVKIKSNTGETSTQKIVR